MHVRARLTRSKAVALVAATLGLGLLVTACASDDNSAVSVPTVSTGASGCPRGGANSAPAPGKLIFGINSAWNNTCNLRAIRDQGMTMERLAFDWPSIEPERGHWVWRQFDQQVSVAARNGVTMLPIVLGIPDWTGAGEWALSTNQRGFANYVARVIRRYGPRGSFWRAHPKLPYRPAVAYEVWNEPYFARFSEGGPDPAAYARLVRAVGIAGHRANPAVRLLISADTSGQEESGSLSPWIAPMYKAVPDLNRYFDGVAVHPYSAPQSPLLFTPGRDRFQFRRIEQIRSEFVSHGARDKPFWITEIGWPTCPANPEDCVNEARQATYLRQMINAVKGNYGYVRGIFIYNYRDSPSNSNPNDKEAWFGLIRRDGTPKPAWNVLGAEAR